MLTLLERKMYNLYDIQHCFLGWNSGCNEYTNFLDLFVPYIIFSAALTRHSFTDRSKLFCTCYSTVKNGNKNIK